MESEWEEFGVGGGVKEVVQRTAYSPEVRDRALSAEI